MTLQPSSWFDRGTREAVGSMPAVTEGSAQSLEGWRASLHLVFGRRGRRTVVERRRHEGPLVIQRPFYPDERGECHVYVLHPPGGVVGGDFLSLDVVARSGAGTVLTTPSATKLYRSNGPVAAVRQSFKVEGEARVEWLPLETIAFDGAVADLSTRVELDAGSHFSGWEVVCLGRPASREAFSRGRLRQRLELYREGRPVLVEVLAVDSESAVQKGVWGLRGHPVVGTFLMTPAVPALAKVVHELAATAPGTFSVTVMRDVLVCRYLGDDSREALELFVSAWRLLRPRVHGVEATPPRIWAT